MSPQHQFDSKARQNRPFDPVPRGGLQRKCASCGNHTFAGGKCAECGKGQTNLQRKSNGQGTSSGVPPIVNEALNSPGQPLDARTRDFMEPRFGQDFSGVRIHADGRAAESAREVNALAYTVGRDVVFGAGQHAMDTGAGRKLMAHELAHVIQQGRGGGPPAPQPGSQFEAAADQAADAVAQGDGTVQVSGACGPGLARIVAPRSLSQPLDPTGMSADEINREIELITRWLDGNKGDAPRLGPILARLKEQLGRLPPPAGPKPSTAGAEAGGMAGRRVMDLRFPLPAFKDAAPSAPPPATGAQAEPSINTPPPAGAKSPGLEAMPTPRPTVGPSFLERGLPGLAPGSKPQDDTPQRGKPQDGKPAEKPDSPGLGLQGGKGWQTNLRKPHQPFGYVQVSAEWSNKYFFPELKGPGDLGRHLSQAFESIKFVGEPGFTLQLHAYGDSPGQVDAQFLMKLVQLSLRRVDVSAVAGFGYNDLLGKKPEWSRLAPLGGIEVEPKIFSAGLWELTWVLDGLATYSQPEKPKDAPLNAPDPSRRWDGQISGELRLKCQF